MLAPQQKSDMDWIAKSKDISVEFFNGFYGNPEDETDGQTERISTQYLQKVHGSLDNAYPVVDELTYSALGGLLNSNFLRMSETERRKYTYGGMANDYIQNLPSFSEATFDELYDIRAELRSPLIRFRSKMLEFAQSVALCPWDSSFNSEITMLFDKDIAPAILDIEEATKNNSFVRNLGKKFFNDEGAWKSTGGIVLSILTSGIFANFMSALIANSVPVITSASIVGAKTYQAFSEYKSEKQNIEGKDLYFYYKAGKMLKK